jgi:hypothetical protein
MNETMKFKKKLYSRIGVSAFLFLTGITLSVLVWYIQNGTIQIGESEFIHMLTYYSGIAFGISVGALVKIGQNIYILRNKEAFEKRMLAETDERNRYISLKAWSITGYIMMYAIFISSFIAGFYSMVATQTINCILGFFVLTYVVSYHILKRVN